LLKNLSYNARLAAGTAAILMFLFYAAPTAAQSYPTQRVQIVVPFSPGTVLDTLARVVATQWSEQFGQPVVVVNRLGAAGMLAFSELAASRDSHSVIFSGQTALTVQPNVHANLSYRVEDFSPICQMFEVPFALVVGPDSPFKNFQQFADAARANPGKMLLGHPGTASFPHLLGAALAKHADYPIMDIPYRSMADQIKDVIGGSINSTVLSVGSFNPAIVRAIAVFDRKRSINLPDAPTVIELGHPISFRSINGIYVSNAIPTAAKIQLQSACAQAFKSDKFREMVTKLGVNAELALGEEFARLLEHERHEMKTLVEILDLKQK
jgi:tripartite-type tricarboxylate transporter receptor subunit TctC